MLFEFSFLLVKSLEKTSIENQVIRNFESPAFASVSDRFKIVSEDCLFNDISLNQAFCLNKWMPRSIVLYL